MGRVWRAADEMLDRPVAVKEMRIDGLDAEDARTRRERTLREARATARIDHPHVVRVYDVVDEGERLWIVMELVAGRSLERIMAEDGPLGPGEAARIGLGLVEALREVHARGVLHRDIKPGNVLVEGAGRRVVLTDFGIAAIQDAKALTMAGMLVGSPDYMAPERISGRPQGPPSDMWSLGATLSAALAGQSPFSRDTTLATLHAVLYEEPELPPSAGPLRGLLGALLRKDPGGRPGVGEVEAVLRGVAFPEPRATPSPTVVVVEPGVGAGAETVPGAETGLGAGPSVPGAGSGSAPGPGVWPVPGSGLVPGAGPSVRGAETGPGAGPLVPGAGAGSASGPGVWPVPGSGSGPGAGPSVRGAETETVPGLGAGPSVPGAGSGSASGSGAGAGSAAGPGGWPVPGSAPGSVPLPTPTPTPTPAPAEAPTPVLVTPPPVGRAGAEAGVSLARAQGVHGAGEIPPGSELPGPAVPSGPSPRSRRTAVAAVAGVLTAAAVAGIVWAATSRAPDGTRADGTPPAASTRASASPTVAGTSRPPSLPPGAREEAGGYAWVTPEGWRRDVKTGSEVHYTSPDGTQELVAKSSLARGDLMDSWRTSERNAHQGRDYRKIRLAETTFRGYPAVVWEYTFTLDGVPWHARLLGFDARGKSYQINTWYQPAGEDTALAIYEDVKESFTLL
ncbi:serine/threonine protein kinase [Streptomyces sp. Z423-1]|uniref:serine/threonine protein kinase n=1 Tax=Streptomyces sp. Z423-1 TaxID=2730915 RepID=UPI001F112E49|nr:serine/threonine protein kinase [Streptomyces sp. Z423-1]